jgi:tetratricopeptide (TPR) repeat protein
MQVDEQSLARRRSPDAAPPPERSRPRAMERLLATALPDPAGEALLHLVDAALAGVVFLAPLIMAGRHPWGRLILVFLVAMAALLWAFHQARRRHAGWARTGAEWILAGGLLLLILQLLPLPAVWLYSLSPNLPDTLPLWSGTLGAEQLEMGGKLSTASLGTWSQLSLHPEATRGALVMFTTYVLLFLVVVQRIQTLEDAERLVRWIALATIFMAMLGLFQLLTRNGQSLGLAGPASRLAQTTVRGSFGSQDHLAHYLALGVGPLIWWAYRTLQPRRDRRHPGRQSARHSAVEPREQLERLLLLGAFAVVGLTGMLTYSRTGLTAMLLGAIVCGVVYWCHGLSRGRAWWVLLGMGILVAGWLWSYGDQSLTARIEDPAVQEAGVGPQAIPQPEAASASIQARRRLWKAGMRAAADYPLLGTGAGTLGDVFPVYLSNARYAGATVVVQSPEQAGQSAVAGSLDANPWSLHASSAELQLAENSGLRIFQEMGLAGFLLLSLGIGVSVRSCGRLIRRAANRRAAALAGAVAAVVVTSLLQAFVDQVWAVPACLVVTVILLGCSFRIQQLAGGREPPVPHELSRSAWITMVFVLLCVGLAMTHNQLPAALASLDGDRYELLVDAAMQAENQAGERPSGSRLPTATAWPEGTTERMRRQLTRLLQRNPRDARAHLRLAQVSLAEFEAQATPGQATAGRANSAGGAFSLDQVREAALAGSFGSRGDLDAWMAKVVGSRRSLLWDALDHARQGLRHCPVQGDGYLQLANLSFLEARSSEARLAYLEQAVRLRPDDLNVLMAAGKESALAGDLESAVRHWRTVYQQGGETRQVLVRTLADALPAQYVVEQFQPDLATLRSLYANYRDHEQDMQARFVAAPLAHALELQAGRESGAKAAALWFELQGIYRYLDDVSRSLDAVRRAAAEAPEDYAIRRGLAERLLESNRFDEAVEQLKWCLRQRPHDINLQQKLAEAGRRQVRR